jgi:hypothetical protein
VTAPDARQSDELREALAEALRRVAPTASVGTGYERIADALLPVVTAWLKEHARELCPGNHWVEAPEDGYDIVQDQHNANVARQADQSRWRS